MGPVLEVSAYTKQFEPERIQKDAFGKIVNRVRNEVEDAFFANLRFENGAIGTTFSSWGGHGAASGYGKGSTIYGSEGSLQGDDLTLDDGYRGDAGEIFAQGAPPSLRQDYFPAGIRDPFALEMLDSPSGDWIIDADGGIWKGGSARSRNLVRRAGIRDRKPPSDRRGGDGWHRHGISG